MSARRWTRLDASGIRAFTWHDAEYPPRLKEIYELPPVLYVKGEIAPEDERSLAIVGTRRATAYGREAAHRFSFDLARSGVTIVSGLARGIDAIAHRAALEAGPAYNRRAWQRRRCDLPARARGSGR